MDMNYNIAHCLKTMYSIGYDTVYNVCKGGSFEVPWGFFDWASGAVSLAALTAVGASMLGLIVLAGYWIYGEFTGR